MVSIGPGQSLSILNVSRYSVSPVNTQYNDCGERGLVVSLQRLFQDLFVRCQIRERQTKALVLLLKLLQILRLVNAKTTVVPVPSVITLFEDISRAANLADGLPFR